METASQLKQKAVKLYNSKAENHFKSLKEVTSVPAIDPLSRKIAEIVTRKELEVLGITPSEPAIKKTYYSASTIENLSKPVPKPASSNLSKGIPIQLTPEPKAEIKVLSSALSPIILDPKPESCQFESPAAEVPAENPENPSNQIKPQETNEEMLNNLEHLNALKEELHRDYPELGLNNSAEGSSFHTNELNELEEACKHLATDKSGTDPAILIKDDEKDCDPNKIEIENIKVSELKITNAPSINSSKPDRQLDSRDENIIFKSSRNKSEGCIVHSKQFSLSSEFKDIMSLQQSYIKASNLHSAQESIAKAIPRCHIDLNTSKASPIYFNVRVSKDAKVKNPNGVGPADCLRKLLLKDPPAQIPEDRKDIYDRSAKWVNDRREKTMRLRENKETGSKFYSTFNSSSNKKKHSLHSSSSSISLSQHTLSATSTSISFKSVKECLTYVGLSPADTQVRYVKGVDREKFREKARPLVNYRQVNFLK